MSVHSAYYSRAVGMMEGEMIVVVKCGGEEAGNMIPRKLGDSTEKCKKS